MDGLGSGTWGPPFDKGGTGGFSRYTYEIPLNPPFSKGDF